MATAKKQPPKTRSSAPTPTIIDDGRVRRKGVHAKRGTARLKTSKNYKKAYRGQGRCR